MKVNLKIQNKIKRFSFLLIFLFIIISQIDSQILNALPMDNYQIEPVTEELRLRVPSEFKDLWVKTEKEIWEPWLSIQDGFMGRQLFWDKEKEEALVLVNWKNKKLWKNISTIEVNKIQEKFEDHVRTSLNVDENPFTLIYEGELRKQE